MIKEIQFQRSKQRMFAMDEDYNVVADYPCSDAFISDGGRHESLPNGTYYNVSAEITNGCYGDAYGNFYITTGDYRGRDIHGGGTGLDDPYEDYQKLIPTYGCLRMHNKDGVELSQMIIDSGNHVVLTVVD